MVHMNSEIVKDFIYSLNANEISEDYIHSARITNKDGEHVMLRGEELRKMLRGHGDFADVQSSDVFLNVQKVLEAVENEVDYLYMLVNKKLSKDNKEK